MRNVISFTGICHRRLTGYERTGISEKKTSSFKKTVGDYSFGMHG